MASGKDEIEDRVVGQAQSAVEPLVRRPVASVYPDLVVFPAAPDAVEQGHQ